MKNYIVINGVTYELVERGEILTVPGSGLMAGLRLSDIPVGKTFKVGKYEFVVLEHSEETTAVILKELWIESKRFGSNNNFDGSTVDKECQKFADEIADLVGAENLVEHTVDLTSDDGLKDYGSVKRRASLLTTELYRRYVEILDKFKVKKWWWLATAYSTPKHDDASWVKCVAPSGRIGRGGGFCNNDFGVRPFCILKSNIFVSK